MSMNRRKKHGTEEQVNRVKEIKHYICDICHTEYNSKAQCLECEKSHKTPIKIMREHYISIGQNKAGYPSKIDVEFEDGTILTYKR